MPKSLNHMKKLCFYCYALKLFINHLIIKILSYCGKILRNRKTLSQYAFGLFI